MEGCHLNNHSFSLKHIFFSCIYFCQGLSISDPWKPLWEITLEAAAFLECMSFKGNGGEKKEADIK